jgi:hypothetical protein
MGEWARYYARRGWPVFPCEPRGKKPLCAHGLKDATTDEKKIAAWWQRWPQANIATPTEKRVVVDVDGPDGERALAALQEKRGALPETLTAQTGKGRHLYFRANGTAIRNSAGKLGPHLDVRGQGGYVVLPPSLHASGARYDWVAKAKMAPLPAWMVKVLAEPTRQQADDPGTTERIPQGKRNSHLASLAGSMRRRGMSPAAIEAALLRENQERCGPPLSESEVRAIAQSVSRYQPSTKKGAEAGGFALTRLGDLMAEPQEAVSWLLHGILPAGGLGLLAAKPKTGKSTLARCLALAVANGEPFVGRCTLPGPVIYLALEEKRSEVRAHFRAMGATGKEEIYVHAASAPADALLAITVEVEKRKPVLVIVDPALRFVHVKDANDYAQVSAALEPILTLARENGAHVLLVYHLGKGERAEATDAILGSTAFFAAVDTALVMKRYARYRTLQSRQRYGEDLAEVTLEFDAERRRISLGTERSTAETVAVEGLILEFLQGADEPKTEPEIAEGVEAKTLHVRRGLRELVTLGKVIREGAGKRGDPYRYRFSFSCSEDIGGTREQEMQKAPENRENPEPNLVPENSQNPFLVPASSEPDFSPASVPAEDGEVSL